MKDNVRLEVKGPWDGRSYHIILTRKQIEDALKELNTPDIPQPGQVFQIAGHHTGYFVAVSAFVADKFREIYPTLDHNRSNVWAISCTDGTVYTFARSRVFIIREESK